MRMCASTSECFASLHSKLTKIKNREWNPEQMSCCGCFQACSGVCWLAAVTACANSWCCSYVHLLICSWQPWWRTNKERGNRSKQEIRVKVEMFWDSLHADAAEPQRDFEPDCCLNRKTVESGAFSSQGVSCPNLLFAQWGCSTLSPSWRFLWSLFRKFDLRTTNWQASAGGVREREQTDRQTWRGGRGREQILQVLSFLYN